MGLIANKPVSIQDLLADWTETLRKAPSGKAVDFSDDPIALSWASYRVWQKFPARRWTSFDDIQAYPHDHEIAAATRKYYRDRYTMEVLRGKPLTPFQTVLYGIVSGEQPIMSDQMGVLMTLPYFYTEDTALDHIIENTHSLDQPGPYAVPTHEATITPMQYVFVCRKSMEAHQWWWTDSEGHAVLWGANTNNPLSSVVRSLYDRRQPLKIRAHWQPTRHRGSRRDSVYLRVNNVELV